MSKQVVVIAPHPDDETLGCGGTLLKHVNSGDRIHWVIFTKARVEDGFSPRLIDKRIEEIAQVAAVYPFSSVHKLDFPAAKLDTVALGEMVQQLSTVFKQLQPEIVYLPYPGDVHSDHKMVFDATIACTKWFRYPGIERILVYETLSETEFGINPDLNGFRPNVFMDISAFLEQKIQIMSMFESEIGEFPFPRSEQSIKSLAAFRGSASGCEAAEAFMLLREVIR
ncbi:PIG-L deacetylase family protein [Paenibacillus thalictri]|uniref:PIG-L family deacetylase n=1 Tax=Paenibacillus thalictri TaxID=2527873 RepID=A0A4V2J3K1_9BACL|nr:PIG-L deacetylase family protein [Paenibacillus thalictri]TBL73007.1 PIG-L family deacetylase [Paenibacillus thalictri]